METILNTFKAGLSRDSLSLQYYETLNNLVAYDSELDYKTAKERKDNPDKIPTVLSCNPSQYENDLRNIVLDLYSDREPCLPEKEPRDIITMEPNTGVHIAPNVPTPSYEIVKQQAGFDYSGTLLKGSCFSDDIRNPPILYRYEETALTIEGPHYSISDQTRKAPSLANIKTVQHLADVDPEGTSTQIASPFPDLQQSLQTFDVTDAEEMTRHRYGSTESEFLTPSFSDSGIQLEFLSEEDSTSECESVKQMDEYQRNSGTDIDTNAESNADDAVVAERKNSSGKRHDGLLVPVPTPTSVSFVGTSSPIQADAKRNLQKRGIRTAYMNTTTPENVRCELKVEESELKLQLANMEGKLEALTAEYTKVLEERNKLNDKIEIYENKSEVSVECDFRAEMQHELKNLREKEASLENTIANLQHVNDDKDVQVKDVEEKLKSSQFCVQNLQETLVALEGEVMSKTGGVEALEKELKALKNALEESRVHYEESFQEKSMLSSNVSTLMNAKSWLMKQLEATKETQVKFQLELSEYESALLAQNKQVEVLKCDNAKVVQKLGQTQEKAIKEKAMILEHLEKVEKDLLNQDVTLRKIQTEKNTVQRELTVKIHALQQENNLLENLAKSARKIEEELQALKIDAASKEALLNKLNKEKKEVIEQLTRARNVNEVCDKNIKVLHSKLMENDKKLESLVNEQANKENTIQELKRENAVLTESIREAQEEKDGLDSAVQMLRLELDKVERRFKIMKRELTLKKNLLEEVTKQKDSFINELRALREDLEQHKSLMEALRDTIRQRDETIRSLQSDKEKVHAEARVLSENLKKTQMAFDETHKEKESLCEQLQASSSDLSNAERKLYDSCSEKAKLEGELESTKHALEDYANIKQAERESLKQEMDQLQSAFQYEATRHRDEAISLKQEVEFMKSQLSQRNTQYKNEVECLEKKLTKIAEAKEEEHVNIKKHCENKVNEVLEKTERERSKNIQEMLALNQEKKLLTIKCTELEERARNAAAMQQNRINSLEKELQTARGVIEEQKRELEKRLMLSIELEREKGRLAGLKTSQKALREHCKNVEQLSSKRQSKITELQTKLDNVSLEKEREEKEAKNKVNLLETTIKTQGERIDELRMRLTSERKETSQLQVKLDESEHEAENILKKLTKTCVELENTSEKYENCVQELQDSKQHHHELRGKLQSAQILVQKLENNDKLLNEREKVKDDLLKGLEWKLNQRSKELDYAKEQLRLADERHQSELETLKTAVQVANSEAVYLRREVFMARKAKTENQEKYFTSRDELLAARQETEVAKQDIFAASQQLRYLKSAILNSCDVKELQEFVKNDDNTASFVTKVTLMKPANQDDPGLKSSLSSLRECMASLRDQISTLQEQMNDHTAAICTTASSWRSFEKNVQTLQTECAAVQRKAQLCPAEKDTVES